VGGGGSCNQSLEPDGTVAQQQAYANGLYTCLSGGTWTPEALIIGSTLASGSAATCNSTNAGMLEYTGGVFEYCNGTSFTAFSTSNPTAGTIGASSGVLVDLTAGTQQLPSLTFQEDTTTGLYQPSSHTMAVTTAGTERSVFDGSGNFNLLGPTAAYEIDSNKVLALPAADTVLSLAIGDNALASASAATACNTAVGYDALEDTTTGVENTGFDAYTLQYATTHTYDTAIGAYAMQGVSATPLLDTGSNNYSGNTAVGYESLMDAEGAAQENVAIGALSLETLTTGSNNTAVGFAVEQNDSGAADNDNIAIGYEALYNNTVASNIGIGAQAVYQNSGGSNVGIGTQALFSTSSGGYNVAIGDYAMEYSNEGASTAVGYAAMQGVSATPSSGNYNTVVGTQALQNATTGTDDIAFGYEAAPYLSTASYDTAIGAGAMLGVSATPYNSSYNSAVGDSALYSIQSRSGYDTALGYQALYGLTTGTNDTAMGYEAGLDVGSGTDNTLVGYESGNQVTGSFNIIVGEGGNITTGNTNIVIGNSLTQTTATSSNQIDLGDNIMVYGDTHLAIHSTAFTTAKTASCPTAGNAAASISGNDQAFTLTQSSGTASPILCVITFETQWTSTPVCVASFAASGPPGVVIAPVATTTTLTLYGNGAENSETINVLCAGYK
jgi:hypothetical protein